jgi:hypothetical protein
MMLHIQDLHYCCSFNACTHTNFSADFAAATCSVSSFWFLLVYLDFDLMCISELFCHLTCFRLVFLLFDLACGVAKG